MANVDAAFWEKASAQESRSSEIDPKLSKYSLFDFREAYYHGHAQVAVSDGRIQICEHGFRGYHMIAELKHHLTDIFCG